MSQKTIYECNYCGAEIGYEKHISLQFDDYSGIAIPPGYLDKNITVWAVVESLKNKLMHFCNPGCVFKYFQKLYNSVGKNKNK